MSRALGEIDRYSRQRILSQVGDVGQTKIQASKVLVIGAGGLGSPVISYLAAAGIGTLGIIDYDVVDSSNLHRQVIHSQVKLGDLKTESAKAYVKDLNSDVEVVLYSDRLTALNAISILSEYDVVIDGSDNFSTRYLVNDACVILKKPLVFGSVLELDGQVSVFNAAEGPCYRCVFPEPPPVDSVPNCSIAGVLGPVCGVVGSMMATEALKLITGFGSPLVGQIVLYNAQSGTSDRVQILKDPECTICSKSISQRKLLDDYFSSCSEANALSVREFRDFLSTDASAVIIDVRSETEFEKDNIAGSINIPSGDFLARYSVRQPASDVKVILYCQTGVRSRNCYLLLSGEEKRRTFCLEGGIDSWNAQA